MPKTDAHEAGLLSAFDKGALKSVATKAELSEFKAAARRSIASSARTRERRTHSSMHWLTSEYCYNNRFIMKFNLAMSFL